MNEIDECLLKAFEYVIKKDDDLADAHEIAYAHRLSVYLEQILNTYSSYKNYKVDLEYNRHNDETKELVYKKNKKIDKYNIRPDIIIHKRKFKDNLAVIELKKDEITENDQNKIEGLCQAGEYEYANGYCISINKQKIIKYGKKNKKWINILGDCYE